MRTRRWWAAAAAASILLGLLGADAAAPTADQLAPAGSVAAQAADPAQKPDGPDPAHAPDEPAAPDPAADLADTGYRMRPLLLATGGIGLGLFAAGLVGTVARRRRAR